MTLIQSGPSSTLIPISLNFRVTSTKWPGETLVKVTSPPVIAAAIASLELIETEPAYVAEPLRKARLFTRALNLSEAESAIVPVVVGATEAALAASDLLRDEGFLVVAIRPPTVPVGTARLRFAFTAQHPDAEVERLAGIVRQRVLRH